MSLYWGTFNKFAKDFRAFGESEAARRRQETLDKVKMYSDLRKAGYTTKDMEGMALTLPDGSTWVPGKEVSKAGETFQKALEKGLAEEFIEKLHGSSKLKRAGQTAGVIAGAQEGAKEPYREKARSSTQAHDFAKMYESSRLNLSNQMQLLETRLKQDFFKFQETQEKGELDNLSKSISDAADEYTKSLTAIENQINNYALNSDEQIKLKQLKAMELQQYKHRVLSAANAAIQIYQARNENPPDNMMGIHLSQILGSVPPDQEIKILRSLDKNYGPIRASGIVGQARYYRTIFGQKEFLRHKDRHGEEF